jgi:plastocyanin
VDVSTEADDTGEVTADKSGEYYIVCELATATYALVVKT